MDKQLIKLLQCKGCNHTRKHGVWIHMTDFQRELMLKYYNVYFEKVLCDDCREKIMAGVPIGGD